MRARAASESVRCGFPFVPKPPSGLQREHRQGWRVAAIRYNPARHHEESLSNNFELTNDIFNIDSEKACRDEVQTFVESLPADTDTTSGVWCSLEGW